MIKKVLAVTLTIVMCLGVSVTALADESTEISFIDAVYVGEGVTYHDELSAWRIFLASTTKSLNSEPIPTYEVGTVLLMLISDGMQNGQTAYLGFNEWHKNYGLPEQTLIFTYGEDVPAGGAFMATEDMIGDVITIRNTMYGIDVDIMVEMPDSTQPEVTPRPNYGTIDSDYWSEIIDDTKGKGTLTFAFSIVPEIGEPWNESLSRDNFTSFPYVIPAGTEFKAVGSESGVGIELCSFKDSDFEYFPYESLIYGMNAREIGERIISQWPRGEDKQYYFEEGFSYVFNEPGKYLVLIGNSDLSTYKNQGDYELHAITIQVELTPRPTPQLAPEVLSQLSFEVKTITELTNESQIDTWIWDFERDFLESVGIPFLSPFSTYILSSNEPLKISEITGKVAGWERTQKEFIFPSDTYITIGYATEDGIIRGVLGVCLYELDDDGNVVVGDALFWDENPIETLLDSTMTGKRISTSPSSTQHEPFYVVVEPIAVDELTTLELAVVVDEITTPEQTVDEDEIITPEQTVDETTILEPTPEQINNVGTVVNCYFLNLRSGASMRHAVINYLAAGDTVAVIDQNSGWYHVETQKGIGWVYGAYLTVNNN